MLNINYVTKKKIIKDKYMHKIVACKIYVVDFVVVINFIK